MLNVLGLINEAGKEDLERFLCRGVGRMGYIEELNDIDRPFAALDPPDIGVGHPKPIRELTLRKARALP